MTALIPLLIVGGLALVGLFAYLGYLAAKKRRETFAELARQRGWTWVERDDRWNDAFDGAPFGTGHTRSSKNVLTGTHDGRPLVAFDYEYKTTETSSNGKTTTTRTVSHPFSVVTLSTGANFPDLSVSAEGFFSRMFDNMTGGDIDFEWEEFNRAFRVRCAERKFANDVIHQRMMEYLMPYQSVAWSLRRGTLVIVAPGQHEIRQLDGTLVFADGLIDKIPEFVWQQVGAVDPGAANRSDGVGTAPPPFVPPTEPGKPGQAG